MAGARLSADLLEDGAISSKILKELYDHAFEQNVDFPVIYEKEKPQQISDSAELEKMIDQVLTASPKQVEQYKAGKTTMIGFFVGQVMKASQGKANPAVLNELLVKKLG
jgi:aspartyl-tRNA(Asn)/glutamyl-tRNA(Gln) amidotransferase subunit B